MSDEIDLLATRDGQTSAIARLELTPAFRARYSLTRLLGSGASGMVWEALDLAMRRPVAIKFMTALGPELLDRFRQEGRLMARVTHPNLAPVYDMDVMGSNPYLVTEILAGGTLKERPLPLPVPEARRVALAVLDALGALHAAGVVHRDVKPANILFNAANEPKLADLGLARDLAGQSVTVTGSMVGTPLYLAPEQVRLEAPTPAVDVWAVGAVLHELLSGTPPFSGRTLGGLLNAILTQDPPDLPEVPRALAAAVNRALAKQVADRPASAAAFAAELRALPEPRRSARTPQLEPKRSVPTPRPASLPSSRPLLALAAALVVGTSLWLATHRSALPPSRPPDLPTSRPPPSAAPRLPPYPTSRIDAQIVAAARASGRISEVVREAQMASVAGVGTVPNENKIALRKTVTEAHRAMAAVRELLAAPARHTPATQTAQTVHRARITLLDLLRRDRAVWADLFIETGDVALFMRLPPRYTPAEVAELRAALATTITALTEVERQHHAAANIWIPLLDDLRTVASAVFKRVNPGTTARAPGEGWGVYSDLGASLVGAGLLQRTARAVWWGALALDPILLTLPGLPPELGTKEARAAAAAEAQSLLAQVSALVEPKERSRLQWLQAAVR